MRGKPISLNVNGRQTSLHVYLLETQERPVPKSPTHYLIVDILNKDLSIKRVTICFNPDDNWANPSSFHEQGTPKAVGKLIGENLGFIGRDPNTMAYTFWVIEIATDKVVHKGYVHDFLNWDY